MKEQRYFIRKHLFRNDEIHDKICHHYLNSEEVVDLLNHLENDRKSLKELKKEYNRIDSVLRDFMKITNELQACSENEELRNTARDMLIMMGVVLIG